MLRKNDFKMILTDLKFGLIDQYKTLLKSDNIELGKTRDNLQSSRSVDWTPLPQFVRI
jgi:ATP-dependent protease HslVU (ClpYQ) ATPase subunit